MRKTRRYTPLTDILAVLTLAFCAGLPPTAAQAVETRTLRLLFIGNSFTHRGGMPHAVKELAEAGSPGLRVEFIAYGGSGARLERHWQGGTQNLVSIAGMTATERQAAVQSLRDALAKDPDDARARAVLRQHGRLQQLGAQPGKWDFVALQSYGDDHGDAARYAEYAEKFAKVIKAQGGRPLLYETTPGTMNAKPLTAPPEADAVLAKAKIIAALADRLDATVAPMSLVALRCQTVRPDLTLRWVNDGHPNQTMGYLTACTFYAAMFERSPEGLPVDEATDIKAFGEGQDADGGPLLRTFSPKDRADLQRIAWEGFNQFQQLRKGGGQKR
jgi:hypothetical protein